MVIGTSAVNLGWASEAGQVLHFKAIMSDDPADESAAALRAKAEHCRSVARLMGEDTRARLIRIATEYLERASKLERPKQSE
ncbi:hypothetical protein AYJ54_37870 [Bradyrhizobium centrolobii]|uniref:Uncharacterized protein n=1 Tax=Bradyrhizobium centrolobii TaxID=1505087 RepID=A0A176Z7E9_9BRAD|nr:hypothetical protein AYJ54_37870 [Bradyrhizobium centrolobii]